MVLRGRRTGCFSHAQNHRRFRLLAWGLYNISGCRRRVTYIRQNYYMRPERPVHQTLRTLRTLTGTRNATSAGRHVRTPFPIYPCVLDVHHQAHESRCPKTESSPASRQSASCATLVMGESNCTLASGRLSGCLVFRRLHSDI